MLETAFFLTTGFVVQQVGSLSRKPPSLANVAVSAVVGLALGLVWDPTTGVLFAPTVAGLLAATTLAFWGGLLFHMAFDRGRR